MKRQIKGTAALAAIAIFAAVVATNCGKKDSSDSVTGTVTSTEALTLSYPLGLSLAIAPQTNSSTTLALTDEKEPSAKVKNEEAGRMIRGEADSCFPPALGKADGPGQVEKCYEFDSEMVYTTTSGGTFVNGTLDGISVTTAGEACMVTFTRNQVKRYTAMVDRALGMVQMMLCQANKAGQGAPTSDGGSIDFKAIMTAAITAAGKNPDHLPFSSAKMTKTGDNFVTEVEAKMPVVPGTAPGATDPTEKITVTHTPTNSDNTAFTGSLVIRRSQEFGGGEKERILTINYVRSAGRVKYRLLTAAMNKAISGSAVDADGKLDLNVSTNTAGAYVDPATNAPYAQQNDAVSGILAVSFNMDPETNAGNFSYWQNPGGNYDEETRGFVFKLDADSAGLLSGCSSSGAFSGGSIRKAIKTGSSISPDKSNHPFACEGSRTATNGCPDDKTSPQSGMIDGVSYEYYRSKRGPPQNLVQSNMYVPKTDNTQDIRRSWAWSQMTNNVAVQCFKQNSSGVYEIDAGAMTNEGTAGFELVASSATTLPPPPDLTGVK